MFELPYQMNIVLLIIMPNEAFYICDAFQLVFLYFFYSQDKMQSAISSLQERKDVLDKIKKNFEDAVAHIQV